MAEAEEREEVSARGYRRGAGGSSVLLRHARIATDSFLSERSETKSRKF